MTWYPRIVFCSLLGSQDAGCYVKLTSRIASGSWKLIKNMVGFIRFSKKKHKLLKTTIFMLMYALYMVFGAPFDFTASHR
ncbi:hypothetical protein QQF64_006891 [Cirrhinus molitorella]|uniref:Uncharacterized protein n=1 Tax=Cirrhinus molitorella TaxID=172907 RepID=A0ABR3MBG7_9TELE